MVEEAELASQPIAKELKHFNQLLDKEVWLDVTISPLKLKGRREYMVAFTDVTENKTLMEQLRDSMLEAQSANAAKSSFLANMSHDIRTPMNAITGMTDIAIRNIEDRGRVLDCLQKINLSSRHLKGLINDVLDMSKIESGRLCLNPDVTSLPKVLENLYSIVQFQAAEKGLWLKVMVLQVEHETVLCDMVRLNQVLLYILANAVKFTPKGGGIWCRVEETASLQGPQYRQYRFFVKDTGIGMSREFQKTIFETFTREKNAQIEQIEGSGLGMAINKRIVDQMNGTIQVTSEPGQGSEFLVTVDFPIVEEKTALNPSLRGLSLLFIDSDRQSRDSVSAVLGEIGFLAETAADADTALSKIGSHRSAGHEYDVILLNAGLPDPGFSASVGKLRKASEEVLLVIAAGDFSDAREEALANGADGVVSPLFFRSTLSESLSQLLSRKSDPSESTAPDKALAGCRVLLAEDNDINREIAIELLTSAGALVDTAENGQRCLELFEASLPGYYQIVLMDIRMPVMNGYEAARRIRACDRGDAAGIPILAVTADAFSEDIQAARNAGMDGHISKPLDMGQVIAEISRRRQNR